MNPERGEPGLARRLLDLVERRAAELAAERAYPEPRLSIFAFGGNAAKRRLLEEGGYDLRRRVLRMAADLDDAPRVSSLPRCGDPAVQAGDRRRHHAHRDARGVRGPLPAERGALRCLASAPRRVTPTSTRALVPRLGSGAGTATGRRRAHRLRPRRPRLGQGTRRVAPLAPTRVGGSLLSHAFAALRHAASRGSNSASTPTLRPAPSTCTYAPACTSPTSTSCISGGCPGTQARLVGRPRVRGLRQRRPRAAGLRAPGRPLRDAGSRRQRPPPPASRSRSPRRRRTG